MIPVYPEQFFSIFLSIVMLAIAWLWLKEELRQVRTSAEWFADKNRLYLCGKCHLSFLAKPGQSLTRCPRCNEMCFIRRKKRF